jgi:hypothetical protein
LKLTLSGGPGGIWEMQASADLKQWQKIGNFTNLTGRVEFTDVLTNGVTKRFYRAVQQGGVTNTFSFIGTTRQGTNQVKLSLAGSPTGVWELQSSSDLKQWAKLGNVTNINGRVDYVDSLPVNTPRRFYRTVQQ